ncbi:hypothetical protein GKZ68_01635 [Hymenobacter sp. BRD128]|uniref:hypothetical protein n=1 Tax=Hymenobacter sp. BRD128 TaxID=2675878 RepID=UPI0015653BE4|nr:hypothetical protein [Hymenobacter sp. BRD128]QKG55452.1 hypothetical protein GKZ68_01635 [Hymenobacter sp. BRD128]
MAEATTHHAPLLSRRPTAMVGAGMATVAGTVTAAGTAMVAVGGMVAVGAAN